MDRIQTVSIHLRRFLKILLIGLPITLCAIWIFIDSQPIRGWISEGLLFESVSTPEGLVNLASRTWTPFTKVLGILGSMIGCLPLIVGLFVLMSLFKNYSKGEIFVSSNIRHYKHLGWLFFVDGLFAKPLSGMFSTLAVTFTNPPGQRCISIGAGTPNLEVIFCGVLLIVMSWVMAEGYKIREEHQLTV